MNKKQKKLLNLILASFIIFLLGLLLHISPTIKLCLYLSAYLLVGNSVIKKAIRNIGNGQIFDENFLMFVATIGAFVVNEYPEGVMVMLLYQVGELFQSYATNKSRNSISELMNLRPDTANLQKDDELIQVDPNEINIGDLIIVKPGEKIPLDGIIVNGNGFIDTSSLTGESIPQNVDINSPVFSGAINKNSVLTIKVTKTFSDSTVSKILELVENASNKKAKAENFITKFAKYYTPIVVFIALALVIFPPLLIENASILDYIKRACSFLVISCPCALVISVPLSFFAGIGVAAKKGILIKGSNYIETIAKTKTVVLDKTGTLTKGTFSVIKIIPEKEYTEEKLLEIASHAENYSEHPIAESIKNAFKGKIDTSIINDVNNITGHGISAKINNQEVYVGNLKLMNSIGITPPSIDEIGTIIYVAINNKYAGYILISDEIKENSKRALSTLKNIHKIKEIVMLTGDNELSANKVANELGIKNVYHNLLPTDKVCKVEELITNDNSPLIFVGDGINDAPVLMRADVGIAMGGLGSDAAIEASDIVIMDDDIFKINTAINISKRIIGIVKQNIVFAISIKLIFLLLGGVGITSMWEAVFADVGVAIIAILNAMRIFMMA